MGTVVYKVDTSPRRVMGRPSLRLHLNLDAKEWTSHCRTKIVAFDQQESQADLFEAYFYTTATFQIYLS